MKCGPMLGFGVISLKKGDVLVGSGQFWSSVSCFQEAWIFLSWQAMSPKSPYFDLNSDFLLELLRNSGFIQSFLQDTADVHTGYVGMPNSPCSAISCVHISTFSLLLRICLDLIIKMRIKWGNENKIQTLGF